MVFNTGAALLDAIVLAVVSMEDEGTYGYRITQDNRRYYKVTSRGMAQLNLYKAEWKTYIQKINAIFEGGVTA